MSHINVGIFVSTGLAPSILDLKDLSWDRFGTPEHSSTFRGHDDTGWVDGLRSQLDPDGLYITLRICSYRVHYNQVVRIKDTSKIIHAEILDSGVIYPMVAEYTLVRKNLCQANETYVTEPNYAMRTYAVAQQFMALFCKVIGSSKASSDERKLASTLRVSYLIQWLIIFQKINSLNLFCLLWSIDN
jgi:hypothetical protein